jgi:membrane protease YdiL (CAAX protease family)
LWQKARDQLPYLLDPDASPPARVSTSDGLIAAMLYFVTQGIAAAVIIGRGRATGALLLIAFSVGGAVSYALMRYVYAKAKTEGVPRILSEGSSRPVVGLAGGLAAAVFGLAYLWAIGSLGLLDDASSDSQSFVSLGLWVIPLAVIAAPVFEEFLFRGLIFGGLRRSFGVWPATLASAGVFAILHPPLAIVPVFVLGVCAALVYERTRSLLAPMIAHAVYNACVIGVPTLFV